MFTVSVLADKQIIP